MSTNNHYRAFEITDRGFDLRQTAIAGGNSENMVNSHGKYKIDFTRGAIGQGRPEPDTDIYYITELVGHAADVPIKESYAKNKNHIMVIVIDGMAFAEDITMTEIGIFAKLIDADTGEEVIPEILYGYTYTDKFDYIPAGEDYNLYREIAFNTVLSRKRQFEIVYDKSKVYVTREELEEILYAENIRYDNGLTCISSENVQSAIDEIILMHELDAVIPHNLNTYPQVVVLEMKHGSGMDECGKTPCGGEGSGHQIRCRAIYLDSNNMTLSLERKYEGKPEVTRTGEGIYTLVFADIALRVSLFVDYAALTRKLDTFYSDINAMISSLFALIESSKTATDSGIYGLYERLTALSSIVDSNKNIADNGVNSLNMNLLALTAIVDSNKAELEKKIKDVPTGCGY